MERRLLRPGALASAAGQLAGFSGGMHLALAPHHFDESRVYGWLFLIDGALLLLLGGWLALTARPAAWRAAGALCAATLLAYLASRTIGMPGLTAEPWDLRGIATASMEGAVALAALVAGLVADRTPPAPRDPAWLVALAARQR